MILRHAREQVDGQRTENCFEAIDERSGKMLGSCTIETVRQLVRTCASPLAVTSANTHGAPAPASFAQAEPRIVDGVDIAIDAGPTRCREASTIVSCAGAAPVLIREGAIGAAELQRALDAASIDTQLQKGC